MLFIHFADAVIGKCFNELDNLKEPDPIIIHLLEAASSQFVTGGSQFGHWLLCSISQSIPCFK